MDKALPAARVLQLSLARSALAVLVQAVAACRAIGLNRTAQLSDWLLQAA